MSSFFDRFFICDCFFGKLLSLTIEILVNLRHSKLEKIHFFINALQMLRTLNWAEEKNFKLDISLFFQLFTSFPLKLLSEMYFEQPK